MIGDRRGDGGSLAVVLGIVFAHYSLQIGELGDHSGHQIGLA